MKKTLFIAFILLILLTSVAFAQGADPNNPHDLTPQQLAQAKEIQEQLWCPICQGVRLDACEQKVCQQMRDMIDELLKEGKTKQEIIDEFVVQYGVVILGEPPKEGVNLMAWLMPVFLVLAGLGVAVWISRGWMKKSRAASLPPDADAPPEASSPAANSVDDDYLSRVERELGEDF